MTRPTDAEIAALLRELGNDVERCRRMLMDDMHWIVPSADRARAMAERLEPPANG